MSGDQQQTEDLIEARLAERPDLVKRFQDGDGSALTEIMEAALGTTVKSTTVRLLA